MALPINIGPKFSIPLTRVPINIEESELEKKDLNTQCQIVFFDWSKKENLGSFAPNYLALSDSTAYDISPFILSCSFNKTKAEAAGNFSITLKNDRDWKEVIKPGIWALLYISQEGDLAIPSECSNSQLNVPKIKDLQNQLHRLRGILYIETVRATGTNENGVFDITYTLSGRDFGVVYEASEIWLNLFYYEKSVREQFLNSFQWSRTQTVNEVVELAHNLFLAPQKILGLNATSKFTKIGQQWLMPRLLLQALDVNTGFLPPFFGNINGLLNFSETKADGPISNPLTYIEGTAWDKLKSLSIPALHELYTELNDQGKPELIFRPIPWGVNQSGYLTLKSNVKTYSDLILETYIQIPTIDILEFDLTENDHSRYNHFLLLIQNEEHDMNNNLAYLTTPSLLGKRFPHEQLESIARHGLRRMHVYVDTLITFFRGVQQDLIKEYNELLYDYYNNLIFYEDGTMEIIGNNEIRVGKTIYIPSADYNSGKAFYIEGYEDKFIVDENGVSSWTQSLTLTRGMEVNNLRSSGLNKRSTPLQNTGDFKCE